MHTVRRHSARLSAGRPRLPPALRRALRGGPGDVRTALQHPAASPGARRRVPRLPQPERVHRVAGHSRARHRAADRRSGLGGGRPHQTDALVGRSHLRHRTALRSGSDLAHAAGSPRTPRRRHGRAARGRDGVPAGGGASGQPRACQRPLHRRYGGRRYGGPPDRGGLADLGGWRIASGGIALVGVLCAAVVWLLLPASQNFHPTSASPRQLMTQTGRVLRDPALLALYGIAATAVGAFVAVYNGSVFRLSGAPYDLSAGAAGLVFTVYLLGSAGSATAGWLADRYGRRTVVPVGCLVTLAGVAVSLAAPLPLIVVGLAVMTAGFFAVHGVASGWVAVRAHAGGGGTGQAASLYLFSVLPGLVGLRRSGRGGVESRGLEWRGARGRRAVPHHSSAGRTPQERSQQGAKLAE